MREDLDRGVEQDGAAHALRVRAASSRTRRPPNECPTQSGPLDPERVGRLDEVGDVRRERPRRLPARAPVAAQVGRDDAEARRPALLREPPEALAVPGDAVQADERRRGGIAPLVHVQLSLARGHSDSSPFPDGS